LYAGVTELRAGGGAIGQQQLMVLRIDPGSGDDACAIGRVEIVFL